MMRSFTRGIKLSLGLALSLNVAACDQKMGDIGKNRELIGKLMIRECSKTMNDGIRVDFVRFGTPEHLPQCEDEVAAVAFNGVSSDAKTWAQFAWNMPEEERNKFIAIDLSGGSMTNGLKLKEREINPLSIANKLKPFLDDVFEGVQNPLLIGHSAGAAVAIFAGDTFKGADAVVFDPVLGAKSTDVFLPSRTAPYACKVSVASEILRRGAVAEKTGPFAPDLIALRKKEVGELASLSNVCLSVIGDDGVLIPDPCSQTPVKRLRLDMQQHCTGARGYTDSVRKVLRLAWSDEYAKVIARNVRRITVILAMQDGVLDPKKTEALTQCLGIKLIETSGGHEAIVTHPKESYEAMSAAVNSGVYEG